MKVTLEGARCTDIANRDPRFRNRYAQPGPDPNFSGARPSDTRPSNTRLSNAQPSKVVSSALVTAAVRPGARWYCQYRLVCAMTASGAGAPHSLLSKVV